MWVRSRSSCASSFKYSALVTPVWTVGDYWTYDTSFGTTWSLVVTADSGSAYTVDTDSASLAFHHDVHDEIGYLGDVRKSNLAGSEAGRDVLYMDFPLENEKQWAMTMDGINHAMQAHMLDEGRYHVVGTVDGITAFEFEYDAAVRWWTWAQWNDDEGQLAFRIDLRDAGSSWAGELVRIEGILASEGEFAGLENGNQADIDATTASDDADAYLVYSVECTTGSYAFGIGTLQSAATESVANTDMSEDQGFTDAGRNCPYTQSFSEVIGDNPNNGDRWGMFHESQSDDISLSYQLYWRNYERITL